MAFGKVTKSFAPKKHRSPQEIDNDYNQQALNAGHKAALAQKLLSEVEEHHTIMLGLSEEARALPKPDLSTETLQPAQAMTQEQEHA